jgi:hypothetical protein
VRVDLSTIAEKQLRKVPTHIVRKFVLWVDLVTMEGLRPHARFLAIAITV